MFLITDDFVKLIPNNNIVFAEQYTVPSANSGAIFMSPD